MKTIIKRLLIVSALITSLPRCATADLAERVDAIIESQKNVQFSIHIIKADTGESIYKHNTNMALVPASNMKIIIGAAALKHLGPDYQYVTQVKLHGNTLVVIGGGDPLFGDNVNDAKYERQDNWIFEKIIDELRKTGTTTLDNIIIDTGIFDDQRVNPSWPREELNRWYACEVSGLNFNNNCIDIVAQNNNGQVFISVEPQTKYVQIINKVAVISTAEQAVGSYRTAEPNRIIVFGKCRDKVGPFVVAIERPAAFFGFLLAENLAKAQINITGQIIGTTVTEDYNVTPLTEFRTTIADCLARCNKDSLALAAESLLKTIAVNSYPDKAGSWEKGKEIIRQYLTDLGIDEEEFYIDDGSGLSEKNRLSANAITTVLFDTYKSDNWKLYRETLAVGGVDGTTAKYFGQQQYKGKILGKTGYISGAKSFSGVCSTVNGDYIFSIIANNNNGQTRGAINNIAEAIIDNSQPKADD